VWTEKERERERERTGALFPNYTRVAVRATQKMKKTFKMFYFLHGKPWPYEVNTTFTTLYGLLKIFHSPID
jgi:hypothetical protein